MRYVNVNANVCTVHYTCGCTRVGMCVWYVYEELRSIALHTHVCMGVCMCVLCTLEHTDVNVKHVYLSFNWLSKVESVHALSAFCSRLAVLVPLLDPVNQL